jgi:cytochrome c oxidase subunit 4
MSATGTESPATDPRSRPHQHAHPTPGDYVRIAILLAVITALEVLTYFFEIVRWAFIGTLVILSIAKFMLVVGWYMHLKFDSKMFKRVFVFGLVLAVSVFLLVLAIFQLPGSRVVA